MIAFTILFLILQLFTVTEVLTAVQYQKCTKLWKKLGCRSDLHLNLTQLIDDRKSSRIDWDNLSGFEYDLECRCRQAAVAGGYKWFAVDPYGLCASKQGDLGSYLREFPLDGAAKCSGIMAPVQVKVPDGSSCIDGRWRPFFYTVETKPAIPIGSAPASAPEEEEEEEEEEQQQKPAVTSCQNVADVVLVIDVSGSLKQEGFDKTITFIKNFLDRFDFTTNTRIGIVTYDEQCRDILTWTQSSNKTKQGLKDYCDQIPYSGGSTRTDLALTCAANQIVQGNERNGVLRTVVTMTDGMTWGGSNTIKGPADRLRLNLNCKMIAIGVGKEYDLVELKTITGNVAENTFELNTFSELNAPHFLNSLIARSCQ